MKLVPLAFLILIVCGGVWWMFGNRTADITNYPPKNTTIVAFGDSLVEGVGSARGGGFVSILSDLLGRPIINLGISGNTTADGLKRQDEVLRLKPGTVILLLGGNDVIRRVSQEETFANLRTLITSFQQSGAVVVLLGVRGGILSDPYDGRYESLAKETGSLYVENVLQGLISRPEYMFDAIHPNDAGYQIIAERVYERMKPLVQ